MRAPVNHIGTAAPASVGGRRRATQADVARAAGVSQATVSIVLRHAEPPSVPPATRQRIRDAAAALEYVPNRLAQALRNARTMAIACVVPDITNPFYPGLIRGAQTVLGPAGYDVMIFDTDAGAHGEGRALAWLRQGRVDGVIGTFFHVGLQAFTPLAETGIAIARVQSRPQKGGTLPVDNVCIDNQDAAAAVTRLLIARGHRAIAVVAGTHGPGDARVDGYSAAMRTAGLRADVVRDADFTIDGGRRCAARLLLRRQRPTAIFGANDLMAIGAMVAVREAGFSVPTDIAVAGFDDTPTAALLTPALTTVRQDEQAIGAAAARLVVERLQSPGRPPGRTLVLPYQIVERASA